MTNRVTNGSNGRDDDIELLDLQRPAPATAGGKGEQLGGKSLVKMANKLTEWLPIIHLLVNFGILICLIVIAQRMTDLADGVAKVDPVKLEASVHNGISSGIAAGIPAVVVGLINGTVPETANMVLSVRWVGDSICDASCIVAVR